MAGGGQQQQNDNSMGILWILAAFFIFGALIWMIFRTKLSAAYLTIKLWEINLIGFFVRTESVDQARTVIASLDPAQTNFNDVIKVGQGVGEYLRYPIFLIIAVFAVLVFFNHSTRVFKRTYDMKVLASLEKDNYPQITPVVDLDLAKQNIDKGPWAMGMTPMQFCKRHNLLEEYRRVPSEGALRKDAGAIEVNLKRGQANRVFSLQVGPPFQGVAKLPPHVRALFAVFAARFAGDSQGAMKLLQSISASSTQKLDFSGAEELLKKHEKNPGIQKIIHSHAYILTLMASMLVAAREDGVQASADFLWLKPFDRRLWYMLNTVGRQTPWSEVAGAFAHLGVEKEMGRPVLVPMVEEATNALELALKEIVYKRDEE